MAPQIITKNKFLRKLTSSESPEITKFRGSGMPAPTASCLHIAYCLLQRLPNQCLPLWSEETHAACQPGDSMPTQQKPNINAIIVTNAGFFGKYILVM